MRVGLLTSYKPNEIGVAWATLPLMRHYCRIRGYTLAVGQGISPEGMFERFEDQFETAMLFLPIWFVILDPSVRCEHLGKRQEKPLPQLGLMGQDLCNVRSLARKSLCAFSSSLR